MSLPTGTLKKTVPWFLNNGLGKPMNSHTREQKRVLSQNFFRKSVSIFLSLSFFPLSFWFIRSFVAHFIIFLLHGIVAG